MLVARDSRKQKSYRLNRPRITGFGFRFHLFSLRAPQPGNEGDTLFISKIPEMSAKFELPRLTW